MVSPPEEPSLEEQIKRKLVETLELKIAPEEIGDTTPLFIEGLGLDSVDGLEIVAMLSMHFDVELEDREDMREILHSVRSIADHIRKQRAQ